MKILLAFYPINNWGGIINHAEQLMLGFKELGHNVDMALLEWKDKISTTRSNTTGFEQGVVLPFHQGKGWDWSREKRWPYKNKEARARWKSFASTFDMIIWQIPLPTKQKGNVGNTDWLELYDTGTKNIVVGHDGNFAKANPHLYCVSDYITAMVCVHPCAYHGAKIDIPKALIFNPQKVDLRDVAAKQDTWEQRTPGFLSCQTFKAWKRVQDLVEAIPYADKCEKKYIAGGGIEHCYMTSKDKCKPIYMYSDGTKIWDVALNYGMEFLGYITTQQRDSLLLNLRTLVDPSWSRTYSAVGDHFNRVVVDAMLMGCVPIARNLGVSTNESGKGELFDPDKNYINVPHNASAEEFGSILNNANTMSRTEAQVYFDGAMEILPYFDRKLVARQFIELSQLQPTGFYGKVETHAKDHNLMLQCEKLLTNFFEG